MNAGIRAARRARGWSQAELARRAGVTRQLVRAVEAGRHVPNVGAALDLAGALGLPVEELFGARGGSAASVPPVVVLGGAPSGGGRHRRRRRGRRAAGERHGG